MLVKRELYLQKIKPFIGTDLVKVITGIRRCGKSTLLELIKEQLLLDGVNQENLISFNFEDLNNIALTDALPLFNKLKELTQNLQGKVYFFLDEIQEVKDFEKCIESLRLNLDCDIYITGSNAKLLSSEISTYLAGRYVEFVIYPFSFLEIKQSYLAEFKELSDKEIFNKYLNLGGMPYLQRLHFDEDPCKQYLNDCFNAVVLKDIVGRYKLRNYELLNRLLTYVFANIGNIFSANSITKFLKNEKRSVTIDTVINHRQYCCSTYLLYKVPRQSTNGKQLLSTNEKYYVVDHGLRQALVGGNLKDINQILENIVFVELLRRGYQVQVGAVQQQEIDFIATKQDKKLYIQVCYLLASKETIDREFSVLKEVHDNFPKYVLSLDEINLSHDGIIHQNIIEFLSTDSF